MYGSTVIGIPSETIGGGIEVIGLGHHMWALVGGRLAMSAGSTLKVTGKEIAGGWSITTTGTVIESGTIGRRSAIARKTGIKTMIASSSGSNNPFDQVSSFTRIGVHN